MLEKSTFCLSVDLISYRFLLKITKPFYKNYQKKSFKIRQIHQLHTHTFLSWNCCGWPVPWWWIWSREQTCWSSLPRWALSLIILSVAVFYPSPSLIFGIFSPTFIICCNIIEPEVSRTSSLVTTSTYPPPFIFKL